MVARLTLVLEAAVDPVRACAGGRGDGGFARADVLIVPNAQWYFVRVRFLPHVR